jgi:hypothetical protein
MGWSYTYTTEKAEDYVRRELSWPESRYEIVANRGAKYWLMREKETGRLTAVVALVRKSRGEIGTKIMGEDVGPADYGYPLAFLDRLSEAPNEYAAEWRQKVREHHAKKKAAPKLAPGDTIRVETPIEFDGGFKADTFRLLNNNRFRTTATGDNGGLYTIAVRLPRDWRTRYKFVIVTTAPKEFNTTTERENN